MTFIFKVAGSMKWNGWHLDVTDGKSFAKRLTSYARKVILQTSCNRLFVEVINNRLIDDPFIHYLYMIDVPVYLIN